MMNNEAILQTVEQTNYETQKRYALSGIYYKNRAFNACKDHIDTSPVTKMFCYIVLHEIILEVQYILVK